MAGTGEVRDGSEAPGAKAVDTRDRTVAAEHLRSTTSAIFRAVGMSSGDAEAMGEILVDADLRGVHSHGTRYVHVYVNGIRRGGTNARPEFRVVRDDGSTAIVDGDRGQGHLVGAFAMRLAIQRAKEHGTATVAVRNSSHCGALAYFTQLAANAGCVGFATTTAGIRMAPTGGRDPVIGLNPVSWAMPTDRAWSLNLDMAPSVVAGSKLGMAIERGEKIPFGWALDEEGNPTDDPVRGQQGVLLPIGGAKGYGLAVILDVLSGVLSGSRFGKGLGGAGGGHLFQAIDIDRFVDLDEFRARMGQLIDQIKGSRPAPGSAGIFLPGEIEHNRKQARLHDGIPMTAVVVDQIDRIAAELGLPERTTGPG